MTASHRERAIVLGADGLGNVVPIADALRSFGFRSVIALVDDSSAFNIVDRPWLTVRATPIEQLVTSSRLRQCLEQQGAGDSVPVLCSYDGLMLPYLDAISSLTPTASWRIPADGIRRARSKPHARRLWQRHRGAHVGWRVVSTDSERQAAWDAATGAFDFSRGCFVKPCSGFQSTHVSRVDHEGNSPQACATIREAMAHNPLWRAQPRQYIDGLVIDPTVDVLIEEAIVGAEYTVDGVVSNGRVHRAVQHKELLYEVPFNGDGFVVSPPDPCGGRDPQVLKGRVKGGRITGLPHTRRPLADFGAFMEAALESIELDNWVFHAEVIDTGQELRLVELNPRVPGGLLAHTARAQLGRDLVEAFVRATLLLPNEIPTRRVTAHIPFYADLAGTVREVSGLDKARALAGVSLVRQAIALGTEVTNTTRENYAGFVVCEAADHSAVRSVAKEALSWIAVHYKP